MSLFTGNVLLDGLGDRLSQEPGAVAIVDCATGEAISVARLDRLTTVAADHLRDLGVRADDYVIITLPLGLDFIAYSFGAFKLGAVPALVDHKSAAAALEQCLDELDARAWITYATPPSTFLGVAEAPRVRIEQCPRADATELPMRDVLDSVLMLYTSGTSGVPKGVPWTSRELASQIEIYRDPAIDSEFCLFPHLALVAIAMGRTAVLPHLSTVAPAEVDIAELHRQLCAHGGDYMFASPLLWQRLADHIASGRAVPPVKKAAAAGSAVNSRLIEQLMELMPDTQFVVPYASTEVLMPISLIEGDEYVYHSGAGTWSGRGVPLGPAARGITVGVVDADRSSRTFEARQHLLPAGQIGEIVVTGSRSTTTYFKRPDIEGHAKMRDQHTGRIWHRTADIGYLDDRGILWYLCRKKDVVPARTATLYPDAIEAMFNLVTGVPLSAVIYDSTVDALFYVLNAADAPTDFDLGTLAILAERVDLPAPRIVLLPNALPADPRHNSKIDRVATLRQVQALNKAGA